MKALIKRLLLPGYDLGKERALQEAIAALRRLDAENKSLHTKIAEMERQEPVATIHINSITGNPSVDFIPGHRYLHHNSSLYALPGAQTQGEEK